MSAEKKVIGVPPELVEGRDAALTPEERLLGLGGQLRSSHFADPVLVDWTREVEAQLKDLRDDMETMREANDLWSGSR